jgi:hypothetical protein
MNESPERAYVDFVNTKALILQLPLDGYVNAKAMAPLHIIVCASYQTSLENVQLS